ncbi:MAG: ATP-binding protein [Planctomycetes bacterium]|nr:ATP-binding protein [Planctomycetota bacterium]
MLEALHLYDAGGVPEVIRAILLARNEVKIDPARECAVPMLDMLFHKTSDGGYANQLGIGPHRPSEGHEDWLFMSMQHVSLATVDEPLSQRREVLSVGHLAVDFRGQTRTVACEDFLSDKLTSRSPLHDYPFLTAAPISDDLVGRWWDAIVLTELKDEVIAALQFVDPSVLDVVFVAHPLDPYRRIAMVRTSSIAGPMPLRSLGDGVVRVFNLAVALQYRGLRSARGEAGRVLLVDEIESGIHHTAHPDLWRSLFRLTRDNDVQVVATTHSLDCLKGFAEARAEDEENDGLVIRLEKVEGEEQTGAVIIDGNDLPFVVRDSIEVR